MSLRKTRKALSVLLAVIIVIGGNLFFGAQLIRHTLCSENYLKDVALSESFVDECEKNFSAYTKVLSAQSGIPAQVFEVAVEKDRIDANILHSLFSSNDSVYSEDMTEKFEELCLEYLHGNNIEYDENMLKNTAEAAAAAYENCFDISNMQSAKAFNDKVDKEYGKYTSIGLLLIVVSVFLLFILFKKKSDFAKAVYTGFTALGASMIFIGLAGLIFNVGGSPLLAPALYADALSRAVDGTFIVTLVFGVVITGLSVVGSLYKYKLITKR